jgi:urease accessory protein
LLDLRVEQEDGATRPVSCLATPPFQLSRVRYDDPVEPGRAVFTLLHLGGVLAGDRGELRCALGAGTSARIRMAAATQVLSMPKADAAHTLDIRLGAGSRLEWLAEPLILFAAARFAQTTRVTLAAGARLALLDILVPGRLARGECFVFARFASRLEVQDETGRLLLAERALLEPARLPLSVPGVFGRSLVAGSLYLLGTDFDAEALAARLSSSGHEALAASVLPNACGVLVRAVGTSGSGVRQALLAALACYAASYGTA